ncbi:hypothetical protein TEA_017540 [Camellia sinensis var. sinensis]|uniref:Uncharacterized protein n=1 Tax=Camellia sinensis var. sinensis TaxID=542762 RepID=A0A4S4DBP4_CAMSN|nr:hypothetical protein TEA_017540 [Camellia sinensis var. sinensis]
MSPQMVKVCISDWNSEKSSVLREKETNAYEEQPQERKDLAKVVVQFLEPFIVVGEGAQDSNSAVSCSLPCPDVVANPVYTEFDDVTTFVKETSKNYGAYHMDHLLLEEVASRAISYRDTVALFLELEKLTRQWGRDRTRECSIFLAELYYDFGSRSQWGRDRTRECSIFLAELYYDFGSRSFDTFMSDASYHLYKLKPKHVRLKFLDKRKRTDDNLDEGVAPKKLNQNVELQLAEASWTGLADALLGILHPLSGCSSEQGSDKLYKSGDIRLSIQLPHGSENIMGSVERKGPNVTSDGESVSISDWNSEKASVWREKETNVYEEQPQERRSSRLERLRSRKPGKEELDFANRKDLAKVVVQFLEPFIVVGEGAQDSNSAVSCSLPCPDVVANPVYTEFDDVTTFVKETSKNYGAYHMDHLLLEEVASRAISYRDTVALFLELEKLTRQWGRDRTRECSIFLAELYYDFGSRSSDTSRLSDFMSDASYHLCKIIESIATDYPFHIIGASEDENSSSTSSSQCNSETSVGNSSQLSNNSHLGSLFLVKWEIINFRWRQG